ncbi:hypothetical protein [Pseudonocardia zijingensis]|uniref:hypothetical protein n=1 Tax=Pseudonocardia zijingensis TaxID=153376 RepID=UPI0031D9FD4A
MSPSTKAPKKLSGNSHHSRVSPDWRYCWAVSVVRIVAGSAFTPLARRTGARAVRLDPPAHLHISLLSRSAPLTPAARAFLATARTYTPVDLDG